MTLRVRARRWWAAVAFLGARLVVGVGAYLLIGAALVTIGLLGTAAVWVLVIAGLAVLAMAVATLVSGRVRTWLRGRPAWGLSRDWVPTRPALVVVVWWLLALRAMARRERRAVAAYRGADITVSYRPLPDGDGARLRTVAADPTTWRDLTYLLVVPLATVLAFAALALLCAAAVAAIVVPPLPSLSPPPPPPFPWTVVSDWTPSTWAIVAAGGVGLVFVPFLVRPVADGIARLGAVLLATGERARMRAELDEQRLRRQLAVEAAEVERRRIERDLHDGAQQRLVSLGMHLGLAREVLATDPAAGAALVAEAHSEAKQALQELRDLARGIHPAILADRGLDAALSALAGRSGVPVEIRVSLPARPPTAIESAAYFVVAESLTNVTRHAAARSATVAIAQADGTLVVEVGDDGVGGADVSRGTGLSGLRDRVAGLGGRLTVDSPPGGPTTVRAEIPCVS